MGIVPIFAGPNNKQPMILLWPGDECYCEKSWAFWTPKGTIQIGLSKEFNCFQ